MKANVLAAKRGGERPVQTALLSERLLRVAFVTLAVLWTAICGASLAWNVRQNRAATLNLARVGARSILHRDLLYRHWAAGHGGVYVPVTEATQPNPYLTNVVERDLTTPSGRRLTLVNPAYMTRQVHELGRQESEYRGHITSLNPIRSANAADAWETNALRAIEGGQKEVSSVETVEGQPQLRLMLAMVTERGCLKCHAAQGYKEGDIRGGLGVSLPLTTYAASAKTVERAALQAHGLIWLLGTSGLGGGFVFLRRRTRDRDAAVASLQALEAELEDFYQNAPDMFCSVDSATGQIVACNQAFAEKTGRRQQDVLGQPVFAIYHPDSAPRAREALAQFQQSGEVRNVELQLLGKDGRRIDVELSATAIRDARGQIVRSRSVLRDITEQNRMAQALRESEARFRQLFERAPVAYQSLDAEGRILEVNPAWLEMLGYTQAEVMGRSITDFLLPEHVVLLSQRFPQFKARGETHGNEFDFRRKDGRVVTVSVEGRIGYDKAGQFQRTHCLLYDVTERKRAQEALRQGEQRYRRLFDEGTEGIAVADHETGIMLDCNKAMLDMVGREKSELIGQPQTVLHPPEERRENFSQSFHAHREEKTGEVLETSLLTKAGEIKSVEVKATVLELNGRKVVQGFFRDVSQRKQVEDALRESEHLLRESQQAAGVGSYVLHIPTGLWRGSAVLDHLFGIDETYDRSVAGWVALIHPDDRAMMADYFSHEVVGQGQTFDKEYRIRRHDDQAERWVHGVGRLEFDAQGRPLKMHGTIQDITDRKQAEQARAQLEVELRQAQKMEAIGQLAGGVAHDFNNILTVILGSADLLAAARELGQESRELIGQIAGAARRAANLTRQLLAFSRKQVMQVRPLDLNEVLGQILKMLQRVLGEHITLNCTYAPELPRVNADAAMLEQVIMNLAVNARDAMPKGGRLLITTGVREVGPTQVQRSAETQPGRFVTLTIADTGSGMDAATLAHIFEPFFTTKEVGKGTGLGLATVYGIVKQHGGWVEVASEPGHGSTFTVFLPATSQTSAEAAGDAPAERVAGGNETILLVEDEAPVRRLVRTCLERYGYRVLEATQGREALRVWDECGGRVDLLLTDLVMPEGMTGREVADALLRHQPQLKVIFTSGYDREALSPESASLAESCFLSKPYDPVMLAKTVRACLDKS